MNNQENNIESNNTLLAPNGQPSNLTPEQYKLVRTPEFKAWFGDWENDPENASKVVDSNGEPLVVWHGSPNDFTVFKYGEFGFHFGGKKAAQERGKVVKSYFLNIKKMLWFDYDLGDWTDLDMWREYVNFFEEEEYADFTDAILSSSNIDDLRDKLTEIYDGVKYFNAFEGNIDEHSYMLFNSANIKLADGSNTTFDANNPDIRFEGGGKVSVYSEVKKMIDNCNIRERTYAYNIQYHSLLEPIKKLNQELGEWNMPKLNEAIKRLIKNKFYEEIIKRCEISDDEKITLYRALLLKNKQTLNTDNLGIYWSYNEEIADIYDDENYEHSENAENFDLYKIKGSCNVQDVDWETTLELYIISEFNEGEIRLKNNTLFNSLWIKKQGDKEWELLPKKYNYIAEKGGLTNTLLAPNGQPSNLTPEQWHLVRTPEFKAWFGDWENDPENASKVVDLNGEPLIVWHGGEVNNAFDKNKIGKNDEGWYGYGFYFTEDKSSADAWGESKPYFIKIRNPFDIIQKGISYANPFYNNSKIETDKKIKEGFDGSFFKLSKPNEYVVFYEFSKNIKLADGTNTTFDANNPDIRYSRGGLMDRYVKYKSKWILIDEGDLEIKEPLSIKRYVFPNDKGFYVELYLKDEIIGVFHSYNDEDDGFMNDAEVHDKYRNLGFGKILLLKAIELSEGVFGYYASDSRGLTLEQERVYKSLERDGVLKIGNVIDYEKAQKMIDSIIDRYNDKNNGVQYKINKKHNFDSKNPDTRYAEGGEIIVHRGYDGKKDTGMYFTPSKSHANSFGKRLKTISLANYKIFDINNKSDFDKLIEWESPKPIIFDADKSEFYNYNDFLEHDSSVGVIAEANNSWIAERYGWVLKKFLGYDAIKFMDGGTESYLLLNLLAPNGKPSNLTAEQWHLVRTPEFKAWFGDWENDPENASKVVDSNGEPLVCYHGTFREFTKFDINKVGNIDKGFFSKGFYFTPIIGLAYEYGNKIYKCFLNIKKPINTKSRNDLAKYLDLEYNNNTYSEIAREKIISLKYDGVLQEYDLPKGAISKYPFIEIVAYYPTQIKLADGSNTTFDGSNPDIRYAEGGKTRPFEFDGNKLVVFNAYRNGIPYKIVVDSIDDAEYITLWKTDTNTGIDKKVGYLRLYKSYDDFLSVSEISIDKGSRGLGLGLEMYKTALKYSSDEVKGIKSYLPNRSNKKQIPKIYRKLNSVEDDDYEFIYKEKNPDIKFAEGGEIDYSKDITVVAALTNSNNEVLILQRGATAGWMPLHWSLVGGMVDEGEDKKQAVLREIKEEIGVDIADVDYVDSIYTKDAGTIVYYVGKLPDDAEIVLDYENVRYDFINSDTIDNYDYVPYVKSFIHKLLFQMYRENHVVKYALYSKKTGLPTYNVAPTDFVKSMNNLQSFCVVNGLANRIFKSSGGYYVLRHDGTLIKAFDTLQNLTYEDAYKLLVRNYEQGGKVGYEVKYENGGSFLDKTAEEIVDIVNDTSGFNTKEDAIQEIEYLLNNDFPYGFKNIPNVIVLYRVVLLENGDNVRVDDIGEHYIAERNLIDRGFLEKIGVWDNWSEEAELILLTCETEKNNIDIERSIANRLLYPREYEFTVIDDSKVSIIKTESISKKWVEYADGGKTDVLLAPNGKPSNLTPEQWHLVRTPEFKAWFGDWENDPENASKVVDSNGEPKVVLHGSQGLYDGKNIFSEEITEFSSSRLIFTTDNVDVAKYFGDVKDYFVNIKNPFVIKEGYNVWSRLDEANLIKTLGEKTFIDLVNWEWKEDFKNVSEWEKNAIESEPALITIDSLCYYLKKYKNYDGVIAFDIEETTMNISCNDYIAFEPNQIKLADGTNTTFDANNPDIRYEEGGKMNAKTNIEGEYSSLRHFISSNANYRKILADIYGIEESEVEESLDGELGYDEEVLNSLLGSDYRIFYNEENDEFEISKRRKSKSASAKIVLANSNNANQILEAINKEILTEYEPRFGVMYKGKMVGGSTFKVEGGTYYFDLALSHEARGLGISKNLIGSIMQDAKNMQIEKLEAEIVNPYLENYLKNIGFSIYKSQDQNIATYTIDNNADINYAEGGETQKTNIYHFTENIDSLRAILEDNALKSGVLVNNYGKGYENISFTWNPNLWDIEYAGDEDWRYKVRIAFDYNKLSEKWQFEPFDYGIAEEQEEIVKSEVMNDILPYITEILISEDESTDTYNYLKRLYPQLLIQWVHKPKFEKDEESDYAKGGLIAPNGQPSNLTPEQYKLVRTPEFKAWFGDWENDPENASKVVDENGEPLVVYRGMPKNRKLGNVFNFKINFFKENRQTNKFAFYFSRTKDEAELYGLQSAEYSDGYVIKEYFLNARNLFLATQKDSVASKVDRDFNSTYPNRFTTYQKPIPEIDKELSKSYLTFKELFDLTKPSKEDFKILNSEYKKNEIAKIEYNKEQKRLNSKEVYSHFLDLKKGDKKQEFWREYLKNVKKYDGVAFYEDTFALSFTSKNKPILQFLESPNTICVFEPEQIKLADGTNTTFDANNPDIRYAEGGKTNDEFVQKFKKYVNSVQSVDDEPSRTWGDMRIGDKIMVTNIYRDLPESQADPDLGEYELKVIPIALTDHYIHGNAHNREFFREDDYDNYQTELLNRLKNDFDSKNREPIIAVYNRYGYYTVVDGHHRIVVANELGRKSILALVINETEKIKSDWVSSELPVYGTYKNAIRFYHQNFRKEYNKGIITWIENLLELNEKNHFADGGKLVEAQNTDYFADGGMFVSNDDAAAFNAAMSYTMRDFIDLLIKASKMHRLNWFTWELRLYPQSNKLVILKNNTSNTFNDDEITFFNQYFPKYTKKYDINNKYISIVNQKVTDKYVYFFIFDNNYLESGLDEAFGDTESFDDGGKIEEVETASAPSKNKKVYVSLRLQTEYKNDTIKVEQKGSTKKNPKFEIIKQPTIYYLNSNLEQLASHTLVGVKGVSLSRFNIAEWFTVRNLLLVMNYSDFMSLNKTITVKYDDANQLMSNNMEILNRLYNKADHYGTLQTIFKYINFELQLMLNYEENQAASELYRITRFLDVYQTSSFKNYLYDNKIDINSAFDLCEKIIEYNKFDNDYLGSGFKNPVLTVEKLIKSVEKGIIKAAKVYETEQEVILQNEVLQVPFNSQLFFKEKDNINRNIHTNLKELITEFSLDKSYRIYFVSDADLERYRKNFFALEEQRYSKAREKGIGDLELKKQSTLKQMLNDYIEFNINTIASELEKSNSVFPSAKYVNRQLEDYDEDGNDKQYDWDSIPLFIELLSAYMDIIKTSWQEYVADIDVDKLDLYEFIAFCDVAKKHLNEYFTENSQKFDDLGNYRNETNYKYFDAYNLKYLLLDSIDTYDSASPFYDYRELSKMYLQRMEGEMYRYFSPNDLTFTTKYAEGGETDVLLAPNGQPSNLTPEQYKLVRTPEFKAWFGDWENDPENASKVVDENGEPAVCYHGAEIINKKEKGRFNIFNKASYFTDTYKSAEYYAFKLAYGIDDVKEEDTEIYAVFLNIRNPKMFDYKNQDAEEYFHDFYENDKRIIQYETDGYNGLIWQYDYKMYDVSIKDKETHFITFHPTQIKLADGTNTTFDANNPDIRYAEGGKVEEKENESKLNLVKERYFPIFHASYDTGYKKVQGVIIRIKDHIANWDNFYLYDLLNLRKGETPYLLSVVINDDWNSTTVSAYKSKSAKNIEDFEIEFENEFPDLKAVEIVFGKDDRVEDIIGQIEFEIDYMTKWKKIQIAKEITKNIGEEYCETSDIGKCAEISVEIAEELIKHGINAIAMRIVDGKDKKYNSLVFNHAYTYLPESNQIIDTQLWQLEGKPNALETRKVLFDYDEYNKIVELYEVEPISDYEKKVDALYDNGGLFEKGISLFGESTEPMDNYGNPTEVQIPSIVLTESLAAIDETDFMNWINNEFMKLDVEDIDRIAYGFATTDITLLPPTWIKIVHDADLENAKYNQEQSGLSKQEWAQRFNLDNPVDVDYDGKNFILQDGHHRYYAASILAEPLKVNLRITDNPTIKIINDRQKLAQWYLQAKSLGQYPEVIKAFEDMLCLNQYADGGKIHNLKSVYSKRIKSIDDLPIE